MKNYKNGPHFVGRQLQLAWRVRLPLSKKFMIARNILLGGLNDILEILLLPPTMTSSCLRIKPFGMASQNLFVIEFSPNLHIALHCFRTFEAKTSNVFLFQE